MAIDGHNYTPVALPLGKEPVLLVLEIGWAPEKVWMGAENLAPSGIYF
jgi:hypothetical protein